MVETQSIEGRAAVLAARVAAREGCELVSCEYLHEQGRWFLRLSIDREGGVTVDDCGAVSRQMSAMLDVDDFVPQAYNLEVSSPGLDRPLTTAADYARFAGEQVKVRTTGPVHGRRRFRGVLAGLEGDLVKIHEPGGQLFEIPIEQVRSARLDPRL